MGPRNDLPFAKECSCGAITVMVLDSEGNETSMSMPRETYEEYFSMIALESSTFSNCNYCVNGWGVDLCGCGSKEKVGECDNDLPECRSNATSQTLVTDFILPHDLMIE